MTTKKRTQTICQIAAIFLLFIGCGNNNSALGDCNLGWALSIQDEVTAMSEAGTAFSNEPTLEKCELYKNAARDYVNALKSVSTSCFADIDRQEYQAQLAEAEQSVNEMNCAEMVNN